MFILTSFAVSAITPQERLTELENQCQKSESQSCCEASLKHLKAHGMIEPIQGKCPAGYQFNMLKCLSTLRWCERMKPLKQPRSS